MAPSRAARALWLDAWTRAVIVPAWRRAAAVWVGCALVAAVTMGPNGMQPGDLTYLALHHPGFSVGVGLTWLLVFAPTARLLVRGDAAAYLRSLPGPAFAPRLLAGAALVGLQLPWVALWIVGEGWLGLAVIAAMTLVLLALARWRPPVRRAGWPGWSSGGEALRAIHVRALRRRAGDGLVRGLGLAMLAGAAAGLFVANNDLAGADAAAVGSSVIAVVLVPAEVGVLLVILGAHRQTAWLAAALGLPRTARIAAVVHAIAVVQLVGTVVAVALACLVADATPRTAAHLGATSLVVAAGVTLGNARVLLDGEDSPTVAARTVVGATCVAALAVLALGLFGELGALAGVAAGALALASQKGGRE